MGVIGDKGFHPHAHLTVEEAKVLLYIGCKMRSNWTFSTPNSGRKIVQIDLNSIILGNNFQNTISVAGDAKLILEDLMTLFRTTMSQQAPLEWVNELNQEREKFGLTMTKIHTAVL